MSQWQGRSLFWYCAHMATGTISLEGAVKTFRDDYAKLRTEIAKAIVSLYEYQGIKNFTTSDIKKHLENNILKLNYRSFTQVVILGSSSFIPFMQLTAASRREVVEEILDIKIFSLMNGLLKHKMKDNKERSKDISYENSEVELERDIVKVKIGDFTNEGILKYKTITFEQIMGEWIEKEESSQ